MPCSRQRASTNFKIFFSSVLSARTHRRASRLSSLLTLSRRPLVTPSTMIAFLSVSLRASIRLIGPSPTAGTAAIFLLFSLMGPQIICYIVGGRCPPTTRTSFSGRPGSTPRTGDTTKAARTRHSGRCRKPWLTQTCACGGWLVARKFACMQHTMQTMRGACPSPWPPGPRRRALPPSTPHLPAMVRLCVAAYLHAGTLLCLVMIIIVLRSATRSILQLGHLHSTMSVGLPPGTMPSVWTEKRSPKKTGKR